MNALGQLVTVPKYEPALIKYNCKEKKGFVTPSDEDILKEKGAVLNWFDVEAPEGRFSLNDKISDIMSTFRGKLWFAKLGLKIKKKMSASKSKEEKKSKKTQAMGFEIGADMMQMMGGFTVLRLTGLIGMLNITFTKEELLKLNKQLNKIKKPKK